MSLPARKLPGARARRRKQELLRRVRNRPRGTARIREDILEMIRLLNENRRR